MRPWRLATFLAFLLIGCGGAPETRQEPDDVPAETASADDVPAEPTAPRMLSLDDTAIRKLPANVEVLVRLHPGALRGTAFEDPALAMLPFPRYGDQGAFVQEVLAKTETLVIGHADQTFAASIEGELAGTFDRLLALAAEADGVETTGTEGTRALTIGGMTSFREEGSTSIEVFVPASSRRAEGVPAALDAPAIRRVHAALPPPRPGLVPAVELVAAPTFGVFRDLLASVRVSIDEGDRTAHIDASLEYPDAATADRIAGVYRTLITESGDSRRIFDVDSLSIRTESNHVLLHVRLVAMFDAPAANQRIIEFAIMFAAAHEVSLNMH